MARQITNKHHLHRDGCVTAKRKKAARYLDIPAVLIFPNACNITLDRYGRIDRRKPGNAALDLKALRCQILPCPQRSLQRHGAPAICKLESRLHNQAIAIPCNRITLFPNRQLKLMQPKLPSLDDFSCHGLSAMSLRIPRRFEVCAPGSCVLRGRLTAFSKIKSQMESAGLSRNRVDAHECGQHSRQGSPNDQCDSCMFLIPNADHFVFDSLRTA